MKGAAVKQLNAKKEKISSIFMVLLYLLGLWPGNILKHIEMKQKSEGEGEKLENKII